MLQRWQWPGFTFVRVISIRTFVSTYLKKALHHYEFIVYFTGYQQVFRNISPVLNLTANKYKNLANIITS